MVAPKVQKSGLKMKRENAWNHLDQAEQKALNGYCEKYMSYINVAKTERKANDQAIVLLKKAGAKPLSELLKKNQVLKPGTLFYISQQGKTLLGGRIGKTSMEKGLRIVGGHTDAPHLHLKPVPLYEDGQICLLDTHYYGGIKKYQWVAIPLALHGVIAKTDGTYIDVCIGEDPSDPVFYISDVLPHLAKDQRSKTISDAITGEGLNALCGSRPIDEKAGKDEAQKVKANILAFLNQKYGINEEDLTSAELSLVPAGSPREVGFDRSMMMAFGHDDRVCAYAGLQAMLDAPTPQYTSIVLLCDKEEIGSCGTTGMQSRFFENTIARLIALQNKGQYSDLQLRECLENSDMISADVSALHDPNFPGVSSPNNQAVLNAGVVVSKYVGAGGKSGTNDASAEFTAKVRQIFNDANVVWQTGELGKVDEGGGGTIAIYLAKYGMNVIDCGVGLFSMHAPFEVCGKLDAYMAYKGYKAFLNDAQ